MQSRGMERWLNLQIARQNGICAHVDFLFPKVFVYKLFCRVTDLPEKPPFAPEINTWRILKCLPELMARPEAESIATYLNDDPTALKRYQLSQQIAEVFDRYTIMRPETGPHLWVNGLNPLADTILESRWQAALWQMLLDMDAPGTTPGHHAALAKIFLETPNPILDLPERVSVFGISALPPFYIDMFQKIAQQIDVDIYYLNPCQEYWEYIYSIKQINRFCGCRPHRGKHLLRLRQSSTGLYGQCWARILKPCFEQHRRYWIGSFRRPRGKKPVVNRAIRYPKPSGTQPRRQVPSCRNRHQHPSTCLSQPFPGSGSFARPTTGSVRQKRGPKTPQTLWS